MVDRLAAYGAKKFVLGVSCVVTVSAILRRPIYELVAIAPAEVARRFELVTADHFLYVILLTPGILAFARAPKLCIRSKASLAVLMVLLLAIMFSSLWSLSPEGGITTGGMIGMSVFCLLGYAQQLGRRKVVFLLSSCFSFWIVASLAVVRTPKGWSRPSHAGAPFGSDWVGLFRFGNSLGEAAGVTAILLMALMARMARERHLLSCIFIFGVTQLVLLLLYRSTHTTGIVGLLAGLFFASFIFAARRIRLGGMRGQLGQPVSAYLLPLGVLTSVGAILLVRDTVSSAFGKPAGLNRIIYWHEALIGSAEKPLFGWGWDSFMSDPAYGALFENWSRLDPHNFFLQVFLSAGIFAFALVIAWTLHGLYLCGLAVSCGANPITFVALPVFVIVCLTATTIGVLNVYLIAVLAMVFVLAGEEAAQRAPDGSI